MNNFFTKDNLQDCLMKVIDYRGKTPKKLGGNWSKSGFKAISANNVKHDGLHKIEDIKYLDETLYRKWMKDEVKRGDILLTSEAPAGQVMVWDSEEKVVLSQRLYGLRVNDKVDNWYLKYYLQSPSGQKEILKNSSGSTASGISAKTFNNIVVRFPTKERQVEIGKLLKALDKKIELNNRINAELEAVAKTLYDYWFVQFDFPDQSGKPYKTSGGKMVWNDELKRHVPEGWGVKTIGEYAEVKKGDLITARDTKDGNVKVVAAGLDFSYTHSDSNRDENIITISGSGANAGYINFWREPIFASDCITVRGATDTETLLLFHHLKFIQGHILAQATGSAQPHVYPNDIRILNYIIPSVILVDRFGELAIPMNNQIANNVKENQHLTRLRDWLLPMLMNGQVGVR